VAACEAASSHRDTGISCTAALRRYRALTVHGVMLDTARRDEEIPHELHPADVLGTHR